MDTLEHRHSISIQGSSFVKIYMNGELKSSDSFYLQTACKCKVYTLIIAVLQTRKQNFFYFATGDIEEV